MRVEVLQEFVHGAIKGAVGSQIEVNDSLAGDLERSGLVRVLAAPAIVRRDCEGKAGPAGAEQLSSVSPAGQVLPKTTAPPLKRGRPRIHPLEK